MMGLAASFILPAVAGFLICHKFLSFSGRNIILMVPLVFGVGFGIASITFFLSFVLGDGILIGELLLVAIIMFSWFLKRKAVPFPDLFDSQERDDILLTIIFWILVLCAVVYLSFESYTKPHGGWDAWTVWNAHARLIYRDLANGMENLKRLQDWSHPYYPLMLPGIVSRAWVYAGSNTTFVPAILGSMFALATAAILFGVLQLYSNYRSAVVAVCTLIGTPFFLQTAASQYADVPLSFFITASIAMIFLGVKNHFRRKEVLLAGLFAGFAAWTKTEGLLFTVLLALVIPVIVRTSFIRTGVIPYLIGTLPGVFAAMLLKSRISLEPYYIRESGTLLSRLLDVTRWHETALFSVRDIGSFGSWILPMPLLLVAYGFLAGRSADAEIRRAGAWLTLLLLFLFLGYFLSFVTTPLNLEWQLHTAFSRLMIHLWAPALLIFFLSLRPANSA